MVSYYASRALEILRENGPGELAKRSILKPVDPYRRFKLYTWKNQLENRIRYDAPADPYKTIKVNPRKQINYVLKYDDEGKILFPNVHASGLGKIRDGRWDSPEYRIPVEESLRAAGNMYFVERFEYGKPVKETKRYQYMAENIGDREGYESAEDYILKSLNNYEELYRDIKNNGYQANHSGGNKKPDHTQPVQDELEVLVTIDRLGNINFWEGQHRNGIAQALNIDIPVHVVCRHKQWQKVRDDIYNNGLSEEYEELRNHPDLQDIIG